MRKTEASTHSHTIERAVLGSDAAKSPLVASWVRSARLHGLDPANRLPPGRLTDGELAQAREQMGATIRFAAPVLDRLFSSVGGVGCCVLLADRNGTPLERRGAAVDDSTFENWGLWPGTLWSEAQEGTNGIGTCLAERRAVTIHRDQHFFARNSVLSCMSAPIFDAMGCLIGVIDVSSCRADLTEGFVGLIAQSVVEAAWRIESETFLAAHVGARIVIVPGGEVGAMLAVNTDDLVIGANRIARQMLGLTANFGRCPQPASDVMGQTLPDMLPDAERSSLSRALARAGGNRSAAARSLGISRATFHRKLGAPPRNRLQ